MSTGHGFVGFGLGYPIGIGIASIENLVRPKFQLKFTAQPLLLDRTVPQIQSRVVAGCAQRRIAGLQFL